MNKYMDTINIILLLYIIFLLTNNQLITPHINNFVQNNKITQYILLFILIAIIVNYFEKYSINNTIIKTCTIFCIMLPLFKMDLDWSILAVIILVGGFVWNCKLNYINIHIDNNPVILDKQKIVLKNNNKKQQYLAIVIILIFIGTTIYFSKKINQYGNDFSSYKFITM